MTLRPRFPTIALTTLLLALSACSDDGVEGTGGASSTGGEDGSTTTPLPSTTAPPTSGSEGGSTTDVTDGSGLDTSGPPTDTSSDTGMSSDTDADTDTGGPIDFGSCIDLDPICAGADCCTTLDVEGGMFPMGRSLAGSDAYVDGFPDELPEHDVSVSGFQLDRFEVTVGRMRRFVEAYEGPPAAGAGEHPLIAGTGWDDAWNADMPADEAELRAHLIDPDLAAFCTWTNEPGDNEALAVNCVSWYVASAFCAWDGGRLPTEAEWEYAAAGGDANQLYPWGSDAPNDDLANFGGQDANLLIPVGSHPEGAGRYGHDDLAGGMWEWVYDAWDPSWYAGGGNACTDCANTMDVEQRSVYRGGAWTNGEATIRAAIRNNFLRRNMNINIGFRCARDAE